MPTNEPFSQIIPVLSSQAFSLLNDDVNAYLQDMAITHHTIDPKYRNIMTRFGRGKRMHKVMIEPSHVIAMIEGTWYRFPDLCTLYRVILSLQKSGRIKKPKGGKK